MLSLSDNNQTDIIEAFNSTSRYLDDLLNIDNPYFEHMVGQIYPTELQLNKANSSDIEAPCLDLDLSITNGIVSSKINDQQDYHPPTKSERYNFGVVCVSVRPSAHSFRPSTLFVRPEPYLSTYWSDLIYSWYK